MSHWIPYNLGNQDPMDLVLLGLSKADGFFRTNLESDLSEKLTIVNSSCRHYSSHVMHTIAPHVIRLELSCLSGA